MEAPAPKTVIPRPHRKNATNMKTKTPNPRYGNAPPHKNGKYSYPAVSVPSEIYALLLSIFQLQNILLWGPMSGEYLPLVQRIRASNDLRKDAKAFVPPPRKTEVKTENPNRTSPSPKQQPQQDLQREVKTEKTPIWVHVYCRTIRKLSK